MLSVSLKGRHLIVLDDDPLVAPILEQALEMKVLAFSAVKSALEHESTVMPTAVFVDLHLDGPESGLEAIPALRRKFPFAPILVITSSPSEDALTESLALGADDFIRKPISPKEVVARLQKRLAETDRREAAETIRVGDVTLNVPSRQVKGSRQAAFVSPAAFAILKLLIEAKGTTVSREKIKKEAWKGRAITENALDQKIREIREVLKDTSKSLKVRSVYGSGFALELGTSKEKVSHGPNTETNTIPELSTGSRKN